MKTPVKACKGQFSENTLTALIKNQDRAQWLPQSCDLCGQLVGAKMEKGHWVPEPHWQSVIARRTVRSNDQTRSARLPRQSPLPVEDDAIPRRSHHSQSGARHAQADHPLAGHAPQERPAWLGQGLGAGSGPQNSHDGSLAPASRTAKMSNHSAVPSDEPLRVFVVDDEFNIASTLMLILRHHGFEATAFTGPLEALDAVMADPPDMIISDVSMPRLSGVELARKVRECAPECRILLFSGEASSAGLVDAAHADGQSFELLSRPLHPAELIRKIHELTEKSMAAAQSA